MTLAGAAAARPVVLMLGDSITQGTHPPLREILAAEAEVVRLPPKGHCWSTEYALTRLNGWLAERPDMSLILFNWGLHDMSWKNGDRQVPPERYAENLHTLVGRMLETGARLVFRTTTPVPADEPTRRTEDVALYNNVAAEVMRTHGVDTIEITAEAEAIHAENGRRPRNLDVHYNDEGYRQIALILAEGLRAHLPTRSARDSA